METDEKEYEFKKTYKVARKSRLIEIYIWSLFSISFITPFLYYSLKYKGIDEFEFLNNFYYKLLLAFLIILIPVLFKLIFGKLPFEFLRGMVNNNEKETRIFINNSTDSKIYTSNYHSGNETNMSNNESVIEKLIAESKSIADKIYIRSGAYLLVGCLIAFFGIGLFYSKVFDIKTSNELSQRIIDYLPRFGALFFIEFIAFFFLKQYRIMLEEYRYYEAIKRHRQYQYNIIDLIEKYKNSPALLKIVLEKFSNPTSNKLASGETTEILETQKILNQEVDIFTKLTELVKEVKSK